MGYASFLKSTAEKGTELYRCLTAIKDSCTEAGNLTRQVVELAEVGKHQVELCDPKRLVDETVRFLRRSFPINISIESRIEPSVKNIAITSGYSLQNLSEELRSCLDGGFLKKPCTAERMTEVVRMALDKKS